MYSRHGNHDLEVCVIPPSNPPTSVGIFQSKGMFKVRSIWSYVLYIRYLLLTVEEGLTQYYSSFFRKINQIKQLNFLVKLLIHLQCTANPCVYREEKRDTPYCTYRFNYNIIVLIIMSMDT